MVIDLERRTDSQRLDALLDGVRSMLLDSTSAPERARAVATLFVGLQHLRSSVDPQSWKALARRAAAHPLREALHQDPLTRRSYEKPRGRPDDAVVLDSMYRRRSLEPATPIGRAVHDVALSRPLACALRHRREWLGFQIDRSVDRVTERGGRARILAIGCAHLREANLSSSVPAGAVGELVGLEDDRDCISVIERADLPHTHAEVCPVGRLLEVERAGLRDWLGRFDLIYAPTAFERLEPRPARRLARRLFDLLEPGGRLVFGHFLPTVPDAGYMEAFMDWTPVERDLTTLEDLTVRIADDEVTQRRVLRDPFGAIGYCVVDRAA